MKLIDLESGKKSLKDEKKKRKKAANMPDAHLITTGSDGKPYYLFTVRYAYKGKNWTFEMWATSLKDAHKRLACIQNFPIEVNQRISEIPA